MHHVSDVHNPRVGAGGDSAGGEAESKMQVEAEAGPAESMVIEEDDGCYATYQLTGVLTHKGTDADGGHYVAWIRKDDGTWYLFDDHKVTNPRAARPAWGVLCVSMVLLCFRR